MTFERARSVAVVGSGTAGLFAALALQRVRPDLRIAIVASRAIPVIGVGEATTPPLVAFLYGFLGLDPIALHRSVRPTWKLGIRFEWGLPDRAFHYAFGGGDLGAARLYTGHILDYSLTSRLMTSGAGLLLREEPNAPASSGAASGEGLRSLLDAHRFAYHLDNAPFVAFLEEQATARGIERIAATILDVRRDDVGGIESLVAEDGRELTFDVYVDATGFRSQLLGGALEVPFTSWESSLLCDTAVVGNGPFPEGTGPAPFTRARTMNAGWCWTIPTREENHYGYVFASSFLDPAEAERELRDTYRIEGPTRIVRFRSGRRAELIAGNVAAIGNAYGFVEPLESTALHMAISTSLRLAALATGASSDAAAVSREVGEQWDYLRGFLAVHYRYNARLDTPFWRHCRQEVDLATLAHAVDEYRSGPLFTQRSPLPSYIRDTLFGARGLDLLLLGQEVLPGQLVAEIDRDAWTARRAEWSALEARALSHADALAACDAHPALLTSFVQSGWVDLAAGMMKRGAPARSAQRPGFGQRY